ncbi:uridine kinase [Echinimonas agarilytica]|uniref:Uridine kinase n=1 Tax=Echinimonas agarilytica TaxID=1215918 RepID=A0AA42B832_9GAMM|nr:uridine kinase [Echinimonas agarilytica]MCM2679871.1 uridine kinase [Echinimonas agarilytica]
MSISVVIAVAGASASGKSLIARTIHDEILAERDVCDVVIISEDSYYKDQHHLSMAQREQTNYDHPEAFDHDLLSEHLAQLKQGNAVNVPMYSYETHTRSDETTRLEPAQVVIIEGILLLNSPLLREQFDVSLYMDTPLDICLLRRLSRDVKERGRTMDSVINQYVSTVRPMFQQFIEPSKQYADLIIPRGGKNRIAIDILKSRIHQLLEGHA